VIRPAFVVIASQVLFSLKDLLARHYMGRFGFTPDAFLHPWFIGFLALQAVAMTGQLYVLANVELGKTMALFGATSIAVANALGFLLLGEILTFWEYTGMAVAVLAFLILAVS
jgi:multidrug transporter EmrE-like cation transporter